MKFTDSEIIDFIFTDMRLLHELPNHVQTEQTKAILAGYQTGFPDLYAEAERRHAAFKQAA
jgi:hypothetical protein